MGGKLKREQIITNFSIMAILKATVRFRNKSGHYPVYIRFTQVKQISYVKTSWVVNDKGVNEKKEITDPFVIQQTSLLIESYYSMLNQVDTTNWSVSEIVKYVTEFSADISFSEYARKHIWKLIESGHERTSRNYKWGCNTWKDSQRLTILCFLVLHLHFLINGLTHLPQPPVARSNTQFV